MIGFLVVCVLFSVFPSKVSSSIIGDYTVSRSNQICFVAFVCLFVFVFTGHSGGTSGCPVFQECCQRVLSSDTPFIAACFFC